MKLTVMLNQSVSSEAARQVIKQAQKAGARSIRRLFPGAVSPELMRFYVVEVPDENVSRVMRAIKQLHGVESIERQPIRRPS